ncbi:hypothetical protein B0J13DRAFT_594589 [Dactylonectria estremocensis]|uniref:Fringe-like glycosyltransferase domain-containing protein n=1 Tax=Dactylonectria estremocensis TaxID=1079267 RepID=A0A9P9F265_9HYPO|nr:hypothetical protein B0J13DRAFT_594589 [Dactylonectria estremocensis]
MAPGIMGGEEKNDLLPPWRSRPSRLCIPPRRRSALAIFILVALFFFFLKPDALPFGFGRNRPDRPGLQYAPACANAVDHLRKPSYKLTRDIIYQKRCIRPTIDRKVDRTALTSIAEPLVGEGQLLHLDKSCAGWQQPKCEPIRLRVPPAYPMMDYSHLIFGVATSLERLTESMFQFESWIADSGASLLAIITDAKPKGDAKEDAAFEKVTRQFRARGIDITIRRPWNTTATQNEQHFTIIRDLRRAATRDTKWVAIVDDDTFFPSLYPLAEILDKYDHTVPAYLGALSDNGDAVKHHGFMAFGGAGIFLSLSLLNELDPHIEACLGEEHVPQGDGLLRACIYGKTKTELTVIKGLHQLDMGHDLSGLYESGTLPISLHHWKSWHHSPVDEMVKISEFCGSCFLQRFQFGSDTILSNGFSIAMYPEGTKSVNLTEMEGTFDGYPGFEWSLGPMRSPLDRFHKKSYRLVESEKLGRNLRQIFVHRVEDDLPTMGEIEAAGGVNNVKLPKISKMRDEVVELWWEW